MFPDRLGGSSRMHHVFGRRPLEGRWPRVLCAFARRLIIFLRIVVGLVVVRRALPGVELGGDFAIGFEVFLLIKVHCKYYGCC